MKKSIVLLFLVLSLSALLAGFAPKPEETIKIGLIQPVEHTSLNQIREAILAELEVLGLGDKVSIDYKNAQGDAANVNTIISQFVGDEVDYIIPIATGTAQAAAAATKTIPIVFAAVSDPVAAGLVSALDVTDKNITGVIDAIPVEDIFALAAELTPEAKTFGFVYNTGEVNSVSNIERAKAYCDANGLKYVEATITNSGELLQAAQSLSGRVDAVFTPIDNTVASAMSTLASEAIKAKLPVYTGADSMVIDGGFATVGIDYEILGKQVAALLKRLIDGETIAENPVEVVNDYAKIINTTTAQAIGIELSEEQLNEFITVE